MSDKVFAEMMLLVLISDSPCFFNMILKDYSDLARAMMGHGMLRWIGDETLLHNLVAGFPTDVLFVIIAVCLLLLVKGADWMIDGVVALARRTGLPRIVIGATIISLGTTTPEAVASVMAAWMGNPGLAPWRIYGLCDPSILPQRRHGRGQWMIGLHSWKGCQRTHHKVARAEKK